MTRDSLAYIGLGANLGSPQAAISDAMDALARLTATQLVARSSLYLSAPLLADGDDYVNAVALLHTRLSAETLMQALQTLELQFGRLRSYQNAPRTLDLDILLYDQQHIHSTALQIPHPRMHQRAFVILPLLEITPDICIPGIGSATALLTTLADQRIQRLLPQET